MKKLLLLSLFLLTACVVDNDYMTEPRPEYDWLYPDNTIYFYFYDYGEGKGLPEYSKEAVREAADIITKHTNPNIIEVAGKEDLPEGVENYVIIYESAFGSFTDRGMQPGINKMYIAYISEPSSALHEFGHELGLEHTQKMAYRDKDFTIHWENMNVDERTERAFGITDYYFNQIESDFSSIMLVDSYSYSTNGKPTSTKKDGSTFEANKILSKGDIETINYLYPIEDSL